MVNYFIFGFGLVVTLVVGFGLTTMIIIHNRLLDDEVRAAAAPPELVPVKVPVSAAKLH
ncbi:MAG: hypothetical protein ACI91B_003477 [Planctomycetota bacterium]|jgi:hypothetical protein